MSILMKAMKNETLFRTIIEEYKKDIQATGAKTVTEVDWNSDSHVLFYGLIGPKSSVSRSFFDVDWSVYNKVMKEINKAEE